MTTTEPGTETDRTASAAPPARTRLAQPPSGANKAVAGERAGWPVEHPPDFEWRFTPESARLLGSRFAAGGPVVLLAAPSLVHEPAERGWRSGVLLYDRNPTIVRAVRGAFPAFETACVDLVSGDPVGVGDAVTVVADPPWYPDHTTAFPGPSPVRRGPAAVCC